MCLLSAPQLLLPDAPHLSRWQWYGVLLWRSKDPIGSLSSRCYPMEVTASSCQTELTSNADGAAATRSCVIQEGTELCSGASCLRTGMNALCGSTLRLGRLATSVSLWPGQNELMVRGVGKERPLGPEWSAENTIANLCELGRRLSRRLVSARDTPTTLGHVALLPCTCPRVATVSTGTMCHD